jgi:hypothetical protein
VPHPAVDPVGQAPADPNSQRRSHTGHPGSDGRCSRSPTVARGGCAPRRRPVLVGAVCGANAPGRTDQRRAPSSSRWSPTADGLFAMRYPIRAPRWPRMGSLPTVPRAPAGQPPPPQDCVNGLNFRSRAGCPPASWPTIDLSRGLGQVGELAPHSFGLGQQRMYPVRSRARQCQHTRGGS